MKVLITAGGTSEYIDTVRKITNSGSGKLGSIIANKYLEDSNVEELFYVCSKKAYRPKEDFRVKIIEADKTMDVYDSVKRTLINNKIDIVIHSMAISDYMVDYVSTSQMLSEDMQNNDALGELRCPKNKLDNSAKISSYQDDLIIRLVKTPKIIGKIKEWAPHTILVGFKLLSGVSKNELISVACGLMKKNACDIVIANDLTEISRDKHKALIIVGDETIYIAETKDEIAEKTVLLTQNKIS